MSGEVRANTALKRPVSRSILRAAQAGGPVCLFLYTDDFRRDHAAFKERGVVFVEASRLEPYGTVAVFTDLYGNRWDLIEPAGSSGGAPIS